MHIYVPRHIYYAYICASFCVIQSQRVPQGASELARQSKSHYCQKKKGVSRGFREISTKWSKMSVVHAANL